ncbi:MAG: hypothetical protein AAF193_08360, partial [Bacteroidota bacterium]
PIYTIALGDTLEQIDAKILDVAHNRLAYLGNLFPVEISVEGKKLAGQELQVTVERNGSVLSRNTFTPQSNSDRAVFPVQLEAKNTGLQRYRIKITRADNEVTYTNNQTDIFIDVLDSRQKVLILAQSPHPDLAAIKASIESNKNYEVKSKLAKEFKGKASDYSMVIFHQLPSGTKIENEKVFEFLTAKVPSLFITGAQTNFSAFNSLSLGYQLESFTGNVNDVHGSFAKGFSLFNVDSDTKNMFGGLPPLQVPFGEFNNSPGITTLLNQRIGLIETEIPLLSFNEQGESKVGVLAGEGIWRWRMVNYLNTGSHDEFHQFFAKVVQYLANKDDKRQFRVKGKSELLENEPVVFQAEAYNASYETLADLDINMTIFNSEGQEFNYAFSANNDQYRLNAGKLPVDNYRWEAKVNIAGRSFVERGEFSIAPVQLEMSNLTADHQLLNLLSSRNGGEMVLAKNMQLLPAMIQNNNEVVSIAYEKKTLLDII